MTALGAGLRAACRSFAGERSGAALLEFALIIPIVAALLLCSVEASRLAMTQLKMERVASMVGNLVARAEGHTEASFQACFDAADQIARPYPLFESGNVVVSSVAGRPTGATVLWQQVSEDGVSVTSRVGNPGARAALPDELDVDAGEGLIVTEVYFDYVPLMAEMVFPARRMYTRAFHRPRRTAIITMQES